MVFVIMCHLGQIELVGIGDIIPWETLLKVSGKYLSFLSIQWQRN